MLRRAGYWLANAALLFLLWELFVDKLQGQEMLVGLAAAALAATGTEVVRTEEHPRFFPNARWLIEAWRLPGLILDGCWVLLCRMARLVFLGDKSHGLFRVVRFHAGGSDAKSVARRALAIVFNTMPPNFVIVGIDRRNDWMLFHQVEEEDVPEVARKLGART